jgi:predicted amidohydrolase YtcJ
MLRYLTFVSFLLILALLFVGCKKSEYADLVIWGGSIYTASETNPSAEAIAVKGSRIFFVGSRSEAEKHVNDKTRVIDLGGRTLTPGFIEGHGHIMGIGNNKMRLDLTTANSFEEIVNMVKDAVAEAEPGEWIVGEGWHQDKWETRPDIMVKGFPVHQRISDVSPDNPVYLEHASGHAGLANAKAMQIAGVNQLSREVAMETQVAGGEIIRDANGNPTGLFNEDPAMELIKRKMPSLEDPERALTLALEECARYGITSFHDAGADRKSIELFKKFKTEGRLTSRLYVMLTGYDRELVYEYFRNGMVVDPEGTLTIRSVKLNCDGALGSRGAWLLEPYSDRHDTHGMATLPMDTVLKTARLALRAGFQVCSHAIGDRANREILDRYEMAFREHPERATDHRFRIEHAQHLHPDDIPRFSALNVIPAMQAIHMSSDRPWAIERLGEKRIREGAYMWQALLASGARIVNGTDAPVEPLNPVPSFYASVSRKTLKGKPEGGYEPQQKMTREQALRSYTIDAAYGAFEEKIKGSIEVGKLADFTVFSKDIMVIDEDEILSAEVMMTIVGGKIIFGK